MTPVTLAILLVVISVLIFCSALFSGVETALFSLKPHQLRRLETNHVSLTKFVQAFPGKSASRPECPSPGRRTDKCASWSYYASFSCGKAHWLSAFRSGLAGCCDLRNYCVALRSNSKASRAFGALSTLNDRRLRSADIDAAS